MEIITDKRIINKLNKEPFKLKPQYKPSKKQYVTDCELVKEWIVSIGKGQLTDRAKVMMCMVVDNLTKVLQNRYIDKPEEFHDMVVCCYIDVLTTWKTFNYKKYENCFPYISEKIKRSAAKNFNSWHGIKSYDKSISPKFYRISNMK